MRQEKQTCAQVTREGEWCSEIGDALIDFELCFVFPPWCHVYNKTSTWELKFCWSSCFPFHKASIKLLNSKWNISWQIKGNSVQSNAEVFNRWSWDSEGVCGSNVIIDYSALYFCPVWTHTVYSSWKSQIYPCENLYHTLSYSAVTLLNSRREMCIC